MTKKSIVQYAALWEPLTRKEWLRLRAFWLSPSMKATWRPPALRMNQTNIVAHNANWLLQHFYLPDAGRGSVFDPKVLPLLGAPPAIKDEIINWGDLAAIVESKSKGWLVTLDEARDCPSLCEYVRSWLEKWGWRPVKVVAEW